MLEKPHSQLRSVATGIVAGAVLRLLIACPAGSTVVVEPDLDPAAAETPWRWIGVLADPADPCPGPGDPDWSVSPLFPASLALVHPELKRFCVYRHTGPGPADPGTLLPPPGLAQLEPDRMAVTPVAELGEVLWRQLESKLDEMLGRVPLEVDPSAPRVRLALLDTSPTTGTNPGGLRESSPHGATLRRLAERLLCHPGGCVADVTTRLALAYTGFEPGSGYPGARDEVRGGHFGTVGELAEAIGDELAAWLAEGTPRRPLVVNLSVAWDPVYGGDPGGSPATLPPDVQAVYRAIEAASCQGAVVVAAAGNLTDRRGDGDGPMLPAAWTAEPLDAPGCPHAGEPMLVAAGGVRADGEPLANARPGGAPRLAAYGDHAVLEDPEDPGRPTATLTGSSVAAVAVSATAAAVAYYRPELSAPELSAALAGSGRELARAADFCLDGPPCDAVRYLSLCAAVGAACAGGEGRCPPALPVCPTRRFAPPELALAGLDPAADRLFREELTESYPPTEVCGDELPLHRPGHRPVDPCPHRQRYGPGPRPWTRPQPNEDPCPNCLVIKDDPKPKRRPGRGPREGGLEPPVTGRLHLRLDPDFPGALTDPMLTVRCGDSVRSYNLTVVGELTTLELADLPIGGCDAATLSFTRDGTGSLTVPLLVAD